MATLFICHGNVPAKSEKKQGQDLSSAPKALSYGEKIAKIGPVCPEIFDKTRQFLGHVIPDVHKWALSSLELLDRIWRNYYTTYMHHMRS